MIMRTKSVSFVFITFLVISAFGLTPRSVQATVVSWSWDGTNLTGATNVNVGGVLYDVEFVDGTCINVFSGCDNAAEDFAFSSVEVATSAANALLSQVFVDTPVNGSPELFDTDPDTMLQ